MPDTAVVAARPWQFQARAPGPLARLFDNKTFLVVLCLTPAVGLLAVFLTYPLGLGLWLAFTDTKIGRAGEFVGLENFDSLFHDRIFWLSVTNTLFYTAAATAGKFGLGLWLALLLNHNVPFKSLIRAIVLIPWIVPTVLSAIAFWWIYDPQFSIITYVLTRSASSTTTSTSSARPGTRASPWSRPISGAASRSSPSACWPGCKPSRPRSTRRPCWTAPAPGRASAS